MKGYIYSMYAGADPAIGWQMTDPIYKSVPTLGACMPNIRRAVEKGDYIFSISGRVNKNLPQYVVGAMEVDQKINALSAYKRFPENRMTLDEKTGIYSGNIIIDEDGNHLNIDYHKNHERRIDNYIIGKNPIFIEGEESVERARQETLSVLNDLFGKKEDSLYKVVGRWRKLDSGQIHDLVSWMNQINKL